MEISSHEKESPIVKTRVKLLVAIANHGTKNQQYLDQLLAAYRAMPIAVDIVVLSNIPKDLGPDVEVRVGAPSPNPWSLPFAHRQLFHDRLDEYDYFIYSEDDTLLTWEVMQAFMQSIEELGPDEIAGFVRTERGPDNAIYYSTCHSFFRWIPSSVRVRQGQLWAKYSNEHAACFVVSQDQLRRAIASGGFPTAPHEGRHDMLCAAATDIYTQCGFERLVSLDKLGQFTLPHLPNKYIGKMGLPEQEMGWQIDALRRVHLGELPDYELFNPETRLPGSAGSKFYREMPDTVMTGMLGQRPQRVLVWGAGDGVFEADLKKCGHDVSVIPMDAVVGESCRRRGLTVLPNDYPVHHDQGQPFDVLVLRDVLHLIDEPVRCLTELRALLPRSGTLVVRVPNLNDVRMLRRRMRDPRFKLPWRKDALGATPFTPGGLSKLLRTAGFRDIERLADVPTNRAKLNVATLGIFSTTLSPYLYLRARID